ncbi:MAG: nicotinamide-nucleotide amidohydrolase family protein, partial [Planctomycetota bacterium]
MEHLFEKDVLPSLRRHLGPQRTRSMGLTCFGLAESVLAERCADLLHRRRTVKVGTRVDRGVIWLSVRGTGKAAGGVEAVHGELLERLGPHVASAQGESLQGAVIDLAAKRGDTLAVAESCTAGLATALLADVPGASLVLRGGVTAYANDVQRTALGVPADLLRRHGAVSGPVAEAMARGVRRRLRSDRAVSITGVAGPGGGTKRKPVGLVWFAVAGPEGVHSVRRVLPGDRAFIRGLAAHTALDLLRRALEGQT